MRLGSNRGSVGFVSFTVFIVARYVYLMMVSRLPQPLNHGHIRCAILISDCDGHSAAAEQEQRGHQTCTCANQRMP